MKLTVATRALGDLNGPEYLHVCVGTHYSDLLDRSLGAVPTGRRVVWLSLDRAPDRGVSDHELDVGRALPQPAHP